jgi:hypothetical protein
MGPDVTRITEGQCRSQAWKRFLPQRSANAKGSETFLRGEDKIVEEMNKFLAPLMRGSTKTIGTCRDGPL